MLNIIICGAVNSAPKWKLVPTDSHFIALHTVFKINFISKKMLLSIVPLGGKTAHSSDSGDSYTLSAPLS